MLMYVVRESGTGVKPHFAVYDSGIVRRVGSVELAHLVNNLGVKVLTETDVAGMVDLVRDSGTAYQPPWMDEGMHRAAPYRERPTPT